MTRQPDLKASSVQEGSMKSAILLVCHHVSLPGSHKSVLKQITGPQEKWTRGMQENDFFLASGMHSPYQCWMVWFKQKLA